MKEVLTKTFWRGVRRTFYEALEAPPSKDTASPAAAEGDPKTSSTPEAPSSPPPASEQNPR